MHLSPTPGLTATLTALRVRRGFDAETWVEAKLDLLEAYLRRGAIRAGVVGVSGGVDSAVALGLMTRLAARPASPLERVVGALMPMAGSEGATGQETATEKGRAVVEAMGAEPTVVDLSRGLAEVRAATESGLDVEGQAWSAGQLVSYLRTPALYHLTALLMEQGFPALLCGTTNRDEGAWIGFFGKASDGMVDLQPISDLHKSEVYAVAELLGVPEEVRRAAPTGDTFDGRVDVEMIGTDYDLLELHQRWRETDGSTRARLSAGWKAADRECFDRAGALLEERHRRNAHKYIGDSPAVHLDVLPREIPGGWRRHPVEPSGPPPERGPFVAEFSLPATHASRLREADHEPGEAERLLDLPDSCFRVGALLTAEECAALRQELERQEWLPAGRDGRRESFEDGTSPVGSMRATAFDEGLASALWERLSTRLPRVRRFQPDTPTDHQGHPVWRAVGVNPALRFLRYPSGGELVPHFDAGFDFRDGRRHTLMSLLIRLDEHPAGEGGGATRFLRDPDRYLPLGERPHRDWSRLARDDEVLESVDLPAGAALVFDHRLLHDGQAWSGAGERLLLRTDVIFERCAPAALPPPAPPHPLPLHAALGVAPGAAPGEVDRAFREDGDPEDAARRDAWMVLRDPYYGPAISALGDADAAEAAAFFDDGTRAGDIEEEAERADPAWFSTPIDRVRTNLARVREEEAGGAPVRPLAVLVSTGAFWPVHPGHLAMMERAREAVETAGMAVLGGYLAPDHDRYVSMKTDALPGPEHRLRLCVEAVRESDWLMVDPWPALTATRSLNFSTILERLGAYLARHLRCARPVRVVYVYGGDNARFAGAFAARGRAVCVARPGHQEELERIASDPAVRRNPRVLLVPGAETPDLASRRVREGDDTALDEEVRLLWRRWGVPASGPGAPRRARLFVRDEGVWATEHWHDRVDPGRLEASREDFLGGLVEAVTDAFGTPRTPDQPFELEVEVLELALQREEAARRLDGARVLSLDPCIPGEENLGVSRGFTLASSRSAGVTTRPGWRPLDEQLAALPAGRYTLLDDDIATGGTLREVLGRLPDGVVVEEQVHLCRVGPRGEEEVADLCDLRDFLLGAREGGLVVRLPDGSWARAPYLLPYVRPAERLSVPLSSERRLSHRVWELNATFFSGLGGELTLGDIPAAARALFTSLGFPPETPLEELCRWHARRLG